MAGAWRICLSAPRRATLSVALLVLAIIAVSTARTVRSPVAPDPSRLASVLSSSSYVHDGKVVVDRSALFSALGVHGSRTGQTSEKIALYDTARGLKLVAQPVESVCQDANQASSSMRKALQKANMAQLFNDHRLVAGCLCGTNDTKYQLWMTNGPIGANALRPNSSSGQDLRWQAHAADLLQHTILGGKITGAEGLDCSLQGLKHGLHFIGGGSFNGTVEPERGVSFFAEALARSLLLLHNIPQYSGAQLAATYELESIAKWLSTSGSMRRQGSFPEIRFARAAALHMMAPFLGKFAGQQAVLAAHRYARRAIELQGEDGRYCFTPSTGAEPECRFHAVHHTRALKYAARLYTVCGWGDLKSVLQASLHLSITRLLKDFSSPPAPSSVTFPSDDSDFMRLYGETMLFAGSLINHGEAVVVGKAYIHALRWKS